MFKKIKQFAAKKVLEKQLKKAPPEQREMIMALMEKDPQLLEKIAKEIQTEVKAGKNQMSAAMKVLPKYQKELQAAMGPELIKKMAKQQMGARGAFNPDGSIRK